MNDKIYLVKSGCYSDVTVHGYFTNEAEAKQYCEWRNKYCDWSYDKLWYSECRPINLLHEKEKSTEVYIIDTEDYEITEVRVELHNKNSKRDIFVNIYEAEDEEEFDDYSFNLHLEIETDSEDKARKIAHDLIAQIKEKYTECEDWELTMESFGGYVL